MSFILFLVCYLKCFLMISWRESSDSVLVKKQLTRIDFDPRFNINSSSFQETSLWLVYECYTVHNGIHDESVSLCLCIIELIRNLVMVRDL